MSQDPLPIDIKQWKKIDKGIIIEKFVATAVLMPASIGPNGGKLIHWRGGGAYRMKKTKDKDEDEDEDEDEEEEEEEEKEKKEVWRSTSFDTRKVRNDDDKVEVQFISKGFDVSSAAATHWSAKFIKPYTTDQVYDLLKEKKFNYYSYNGSGSGCLTWTTELVALFETEGLLIGGSKQSFLKTVQVVRENPKFWVPEEPGAQFNWH